jgi:hypothetical protein
VVDDLFSRQIARGSMGSRVDSRLVVDALELAPARRGFLRALKGLAQRNCRAGVETKAAVPTPGAMMGSFFEVRKTDDEFAEIYAELSMPIPLRAANSSLLPPSRGGIDLLISAVPRL